MGVYVTTRYIFFTIFWNHDFQRQFYCGWREIALRSTLRLVIFEDDKVDDEWSISNELWKVSHNGRTILYCETETSGRLWRILLENAGLAAQQYTSVNSGRHLARWPGPYDQWATTALEDFRSGKSQWYVVCTQLIILRWFFNDARGMPQTSLQSLPSSLGRSVSQWMKNAKSDRISFTLLHSLHLLENEWTSGGGVISAIVKNSMNM